MCGKLWSCNLHCSESLKYKQLADEVLDMAGALLAVFKMAQTLDIWKVQTTPTMICRRSFNLIAPQPRQLEQLRLLMMAISLVDKPLTTTPRRLRLRQLELLLRLLMAIMASAPKWSLAINVFFFC